MSKPLRSAQCTQGRRMAGARALWRANGMKEEQIGKPVIAVVNSFTQFVPGHTHLHEIGQFVKQEIEKLGCFAAEFNTIAIDDGIAMGHDGMLYSLPSRDLIADSVEYMVNAHKADAMVCISNCDKITPGMLMAAMRLNIPAIFVSGGPMEAGHLGNRPLDLIDVMIDSADTTVDDTTVTHLEQFGCPTCGSCSGMFTANSMNCLNEAIGLALPGNGTILATHTNRKELFRRAAAQIVENCRAYYFDDDASVLPRSIATRQAMLNAMTLDIAMGGSTNTVLHLLAVANEAGVDFTMNDIDVLSRKTPVLCKVAPNSKYHIEDVNRAGVSTYTSAFAFAGTCVFGKQLLGPLFCHLVLFQGFLPFAYLRSSFSLSYGCNLPSSLTRVFPRTLGFSPRLPVSVYGTGGYFLTRSFSWQCRIYEFVILSYNSPSCLCFQNQGFASDSTYALGRALPVARSYAFLRRSIAQTIVSGTGISTCCPSPMRLRLGLGPDLP